MKLVALVALVLVSLSGCGGDSSNEQSAQVVVFVALDRAYSEPILDEFALQTGIEVLPVYDTEAAKTTGLVNRLIARKDNPECDVWWNNEASQTQALADMGLLQPYESPEADRFPAAFRDEQQRWTGFAGRLRVIIYNTQQLSAEEAPRSLAAFIDPRWRGEAAMALPYFGTTFTHMAVLRDRWGEAKLEQWLYEAKDNELIVAPGNGPVRDLVAMGEATFGLTDTDDARGAMLDGKPVEVTLPDADAGPVLIPNTVAIMRGAPNEGAARKLVDYLLSAEVERKLAEARSAQIPLARDLADVPTPWDGLLPGRTSIGSGPSAAADRQAVIELLDRVGLSP